MEIESDDTKLLGFLRKTTSWVSKSFFSRKCCGLFFKELKSSFVLEAKPMVCLSLPRTNGIDREPLEILKPSKRARD